MITSNDDLIKYRTSRSLETLKEADLLIQNEFWNASINRIYYACYYAVSALLLKSNINSSSHKGNKTVIWITFYTDRFDF
jgi:uncharacterized protein (UPF0332 family)